jgi:hypothetical protein
MAIDTSDAVSRSVSVKFCTRARVAGLQPQHLHVTGSSCGKRKYNSRLQEGLQGLGVKKARDAHGRGMVILVSSLKSIQDPLPTHHD